MDKQAVIIDTNNVPFNHVGEIAGSRRIIQSFTGGRDIIRIDLKFATFGRKNTKDVFFRVKSDLNSAEDLALLKVNASELKNDEWQSFVFTPVRSEKTGIFFIVVDSPDSTPGDAITPSGDLRQRGL